MSKILVVAAHPDDEILGVGGTVARRTAAGDEAWALILGEGQTSRWDKREAAAREVVESLHQDTLEAAKIIGYKEVFFEDLPDNRFDSVDLLDVVKKIEQYIKKLRPDVVYTHHDGDLNIDHRITCAGVLTATRPVGECSVKEVYQFETLSSSEWNFGRTGAATTFLPNVFVDIEEFFTAKCAAMQKYHSELCEFPHPRSLDMLRILAQGRGSMVGLHYAEAFEAARIVVMSPNEAGATEADSQSSAPEEKQDKVLFLTNNNNALVLYDWLKARCKTSLYSEPLRLAQVQAFAPDLIISYNYNYIITQDIIDFMQGRIVNLHISLLPWNRGFSPNIWSFIDDTPKGVTIHQINAGLDTGKIIAQKEFCFDPEKETFVSTYEKLNREIVKLFIENWDAIRSGTCSLYSQQGKGSYHSMQDLKDLKAKIGFAWSDNIADFLQRYHSMSGGGYRKSDLYLDAAWHQVRAA